ncbi:IS30 family transposase [Cellulomonas sp. PS-H5]|uniref:IS30 family transposase n=1 Tax=Cellulomonas sp. PS-H5 TaxID=2820400 RepID=UPI001C4F4B14|nr:IS30 family transposase [Cellulomonas sp. PS-H5]MBW0253694.1 IS30 family transposase [Cellulomonas sp. PS-H5]
MVRGVVLGEDVRERAVALVAAGSSLSAAGRLLGVAVSTLRPWVVAAFGEPMAMGPRGGLRLPRPPAGEPSGRLLSGEDRAVIQAGLAQGLTMTAIAVLIGRDKSTVSREVARGRSADGVYRSQLADRMAAGRRARPKAFKLAADPALAAVVTEGLDQGWSPGLIAKMLKTAHPHDHTGRVSHETIYRALYVQARGGLRQDLAKRLSTGQTARKPRTRAAVGARATFSGALRISQRPPEVTDRAVPGHWEGDLIMGTRNASAIGTLVERSTRFAILLHLPQGRRAEAVAEAMIAAMSDLPAHLRRSITWDRGSEMAAYDRIQLDLQAPVYFADPHSPWQRGSNENTNRLLRFWFTKGTDLSTWTPEEIRRVQDMLNARPRPTLDLRTPAQALAELLTAAA